MRTRDTDEPDYLRFGDQGLTLEFDNGRAERDAGRLVGQDVVSVGHLSGTLTGRRVFSHDACGERLLSISRIKRAPKS